MHRCPHLRASFIFYCLLISVALFLPYQHAYAASAVNMTGSAITVTQESSALHYPGSIDFQLDAHDTASTITQAIVYLKYNQDMSFSEQHTVQPTTAAATIALSWHENTYSNQFNPVGTQISYYWMILDSTGNSYTSAIQTFKVVDTRFQWQQLAQGMFRVHWYGQDTTFGQMLLTQVAGHIQRISQTLGVGLQQPIDIWVYSSANDFHGSLSPLVHEWVGGIAFPTLKQAEIVVNGPYDDTLRRDMPHELTHLIFHQQAHTPIPLWFDEGLAVYNQLYHEPDMLNAYKRALNNHSLLALQDITSSFPTNSNAAYIAYAQSWQLLDYMYRAFGQQKMAALIKSTGQPGKIFNQDLQQTLGLNSNQLENQWRRSIDQPQLANSGTQVQGPTLPVPVITLNDPLQPYLFTAGGLLIAIALFGCVSFLLTNAQRRKNMLAYQQAVKTAQRSMTGPHSLTSSYPGPGKAYTEYKYQYPYQYPYPGPNSPSTNNPPGNGQP